MSHPRTIILLAGAGFIFGLVCLLALVRTNGSVSNMISARGTIVSIDASADFIVIARPTETNLPEVKIYWDKDTSFIRITPLERDGVVYAQKDEPSSYKDLHVGDRVFVHIAPKKVYTAISVEAGGIFRSI